nr:3-hydroxyacyl-CoA dehydrogenase [Candidatus Freyarchaeota archaeon]
MVDKVRRTAVIGAGTMGADLSLLLALSDFDVIVSDKSKEVLDKLGEKQRKTMDEIRAAGITPKTYDAVQKKITTTINLADINDVDFVLEAVAEDLDVKRSLFKELDDKLPMYVVFATNTSSLRVSDIAKGLKGATRLGGMHFSNPPILSPLVEVVKGEKTSEETIRTISWVAEKMGKTPVVLRKDVNGMVLDRVLMSAGTEVLWAIQKGEVTPEEIEAAHRSIGFPVGFPVGTDLIGLDIMLAMSKNYHRVYGERMHVPEKMLEARIKEGKLGKKSGQGFFDWSKGDPVIDMKLAGKFDSMRTIAVTTNEAFWLMKDGVADAETINKIIMLGFRAPVGLSELADAIGLDKLLEVLRKRYKETRLEVYKPCPLFVEYVKKGWKGKAAGRGFFTYPAEAVKGSS